MILQYTDENVKDIIADGFQFSFDNETLKKIQDLSDEVGDPEYIRTPQFPKKQTNSRSSAHGGAIFIIL